MKSTAQMLKELIALDEEDPLPAWPHDFLFSVFRQVEVNHKGDVTKLTARQVEKIEELWLEHCIDKSIDHKDDLFLKG